MATQRYVVRVVWGLHTGATIGTFRSEDEAWSFVERQPDLDEGVVEIESIISPRAWEDDGVHPEFPGAHFLGGEGHFALLAYRPPGLEGYSGSTVSLHPTREAAVLVGKRLRFYSDVRIVHRDSCSCEEAKTTVQLRGELGLVDA